MAELTRRATSQGQLLTMNVIMALSWLEIGIESVSTLATGREMNLSANVSTYPT